MYAVDPHLNMVVDMTRLERYELNRIMQLFQVG